MIEIVKLDLDGNPEKEIILTDVPEKLNELLEKLKQGAVSQRPLRRLFDGVQRRGTYGDRTPSLDGGLQIGAHAGRSSA